MQAVPQKSFIPWLFRQQAAPPVDALLVGQHGWLQIHLVRRTTIQRLRTAAMWNLGQPILVTAISTFMPHPPMLTLQAVNRASTY